MESDVFLFIKYWSKITIEPWWYWGLDTPTAYESSRI